MGVVAGEVGFISGMTGAVVGTVASTGGVVVGIFVLIALGGFFVVRVRKKKNAVSL